MSSTGEGANGAAEVARGEAGRTLSLFYVVFVSSAEFKLCKLPNTQIGFKLRLTDI